jgi:hypothetical protein
MSREFITTQYEFSHGKKPRGTGTWAFVPADSIWPDRNTMPQDAIAWAWGSYSDAKREVAAKWPSVSAWKVLS